MLEPPLTTQSSTHEESIAPSAAISSFHYDGELSQITRLWLVNLALFIVTLSFYRFWGRTRIRHYVWNHTSILGSRLEYHGTGKELCIGFLITLPIFLGIGLINHLTEGQGGNALYIPLLILGYFAVYAGMRYRVTRTSWRAIRGHMLKDGYNDYQGISIKRAFINFITLGIAIPRSSLLKWECLVESISLGSMKVAFTFDMKQIGVAHILSLIIGMIVLGVVSTLCIAALLPFLGGEDADSATKATAGIAGFIISYPFYYMVRQWYTGILVRKKLSGITLGTIKLQTHFSILNFMIFKTVNMLILLCTLGLGSAFILHRKARFFSKYLTFEGTLDEVIIADAQQQSGIVAEGFMDSFGFDLAIMS